MKSCAVLDIDATLVDMFGTYDNWKHAKLEYRENALERIICIDSADLFYWGTKRPHLDEFLKTCFETFDIVGIWSAGSKSYVKEMVKEIFCGKEYYPYFVWSKEYCVSQLDFSNKMIVKQKPLTKLYDTFPEIDPKRTLIFDDRIDVTHQDMLNHVWVQPWGTGYETVGKSDDFFLRLSSQLPRLKNLIDYRFVSFNL